MSMKSLEDLSKKMKELANFTNEINGELGVVNFNPFDAESIEHAIVKMEELIDQKAQSYSSNSMISELVVEMKESYRQQIIDKAAESRSTDGGDVQDVD